MRREWVRWSWKGTALLWTALGVWTSGVGQNLTWLGRLPGRFISEAYDVSADGKVVVGESNTPGQSRAFRWTAQTGMQDLGTLGGSFSVAYGVSADGSVVVGVANNIIVWNRAFRWTMQTGMRDLGTLGGLGSWAYDVSADGSVVVGFASNAGDAPRAFRWTTQENRMRDITPREIRAAFAYGVSADGLTVVGFASTYNNLAFLWTSQNGMQTLNPPDGSSCLAYALSADGAVVVGRYGYAGNERAFRWTAQEGMQDLGVLHAEARGVSADGTTVVGIVWGSSGYHYAFRWTVQGGLEDLNETYANLLTDGSVLIRANAISPDGRFIVGRGYNAATGLQEAFLLDTGSPLRGDVTRDGCVDDADLLAILYRFGGSGFCNEDIDWNGNVDDADLLQVLFNFGQGC